MFSLVQTSWKASIAITPLLACQKKRASHASARGIISVVFGGRHTDKWIHGSQDMWIIEYSWIIGSLRSKCRPHPDCTVFPTSCGYNQVAPSQCRTYCTVTGGDLVWQSKSVIWSCLAPANCWTGAVRVPGHGGCNMNRVGHVMYVWHVVGVLRACCQYVGHV